VLTWLDEIEQQFKIMNLNDLDKFNLIHVCPQSEAHQWYIQYKEQITSWSIFIRNTTKTKSFASNLQRDLVFKKLKQYHQTINQSATHYYTEMLKLMEQANVLLGKDDVADIVLLDIDPFT